MAEEMTDLTITSLTNCYNLEYNPSNGYAQ